MRTLVASGAGGTRLSERVCILLRDVGLGLAFAWKRASPSSLPCSLCPGFTLDSWDAVEGLSNFFEGTWWGAFQASRPSSLHSPLPWFEAGCVPPLHSEAFHPFPQGCRHAFAQCLHLPLPGGRRCRPAGGLPPTTDLLLLVSLIAYN